MTLHPQLNPFAQAGRHAAVDGLLHLLVVTARAEMAQNDQFVLEFLRSFNDVVEMRVAEFVDLLFAMLGTEERQLGDQDLRLVHGRVSIQTVG